MFNRRLVLYRHAMAGIVDASLEGRVVPFHLKVTIERQSTNVAIELIQAVKAIGGSSVEKQCGASFRL